MWRLFRAPRALFKAPRALISSPKTVMRISQTPKKAVHVQRVKFSRRLRLRNLLISGVFVFAGYHAYSTVVLSPLVRWLEDEEENLTPSERKALDDRTPDAFFPLPLTTRTVQPPPYSGQDPEWHEYIRVSKNVALQNQMRETLAQKVRKSAESSVLLTMKTGKNMKVRRWWLDIDYPYRPPVEYRRTGILITDDTIALAEAPVDPAIVNTIDRVLWPSPIFLSTVAFAITMVRQNTQDILRAFGYEPKSSPVFPTIPGVVGSQNAAGGSPVPASQHHPDIQRALERIRQQATKRPEDVKDPRAMASRSEHGAAASHAKPGPNNQLTPADGSQQRPDELFPGQSAMHSATSEPWKALKQRFKKSWKPKPEVPPRGSVAVSGLVELETPTSYVVIDVIAWWNPKTRSYHDKSIVMRLRRAQQKAQRPFR